MSNSGLGTRATRILLTAAFGAALLSPTTARAGGLVFDVPGKAAGERLGSVAAAGDVDGDGVGDLLVGSPHDGTNGADAGRVLVASGADGSTLLEVLGAAAGDRLGASVAGLGDVDGDGHDDIAAGAPGADTVLVVSGGGGQVLLTLTGAAGGGFGHAVSGVGDLDGDGANDLVVGAPFESPAGAASGAAHGFSGATGASLFSLSGDGPGDNFGHSVSGLDPTTGFSDPDVDIFIGATQGDSGGSGYARAHDRVDQSVLFSIAGGQAWDHFGHIVTHVGDIDGDGTGDLLVSSNPRDAAGNPTAPGYVHAVSGSDGSIIHTVSGQVGQGFGASVTGVGDLDGDGRSEFAVGVPKADANGQDAGVVRIFSGFDGSMDQQVAGGAAGDEFGRSIAGLGDVDGDGFGDLAAASPLHDGAATDAGVAQVLTLDRWQSLEGGVAGIGGLVPVLEGDGPLVEETEVLLTLEDARPDAAVTLVLGASLMLDPVSQEFIPVSDEVVTGLVTSSAGSLAYTFTWPAGASDVNVYYQFSVDDPDAPNGTARSNTIRGAAP